MKYVAGHNPQAKEPCKWKCGKELKPAGKTQHEKFCKKRPDHVEVISKHRALFVRESRPAKESPTIATSVEQAYEMFHGDAALFYAVCHMLAAQSGKDVLTNLTDAKNMIDLKIKTLTR